MDCRDVKCAWTGPCEVCVAVDFVFHFGAHSPGASFGFAIPVPVGAGPLELAYAVYGVRRLQRAGLCRVWESQIEVRARRMPSLG